MKRRKTITRALDEKTASNAVLGFV